MSRNYRRAWWYGPGGWRRRGIWYNKRLVSIGGACAYRVSLSNSRCLWNFYAWPHLALTSRRVWNEQTFLSRGVVEYTLVRTSRLGPSSTLLGWWYAYDVLAQNSELEVCCSSNFLNGRIDSISWTSAQHMRVCRWNVNARAIRRIIGNSPYSERGA